MRQLKISKQPTNPTWETDRAQAIPFLQSLAATQPLGLAAEAEEKLLRFIVAVATQYRGRGWRGRSYCGLGIQGHLGV
ncbi:hypothetical protein [Hymenobacter cheonanensis]|uniref:hypothetical protein n=1 Tax=Hymenobacter sp. CA2-7 TaxID=3063993 RepID=UPI00272CFD67|nr:hypothetical protein [Hymenobacter sp. CA2-7]